MTHLHYRANFIKQSEKDIFYKYFPDTIYQKGIYGQFKFNIENWQPIITSKANPQGEIVVYVDEHCVSALTQKIKEYFQKHNEFPKVSFWVA